MSIQNLSIRLLRQGMRVENAIRIDGGLTEVPAQGARLYIAQSPIHAPAWVEFIRRFARGPLEGLTTKSCGGVLFVQGTVPAEVVEGANEMPDIPFICAISFGTAHHGLEPDAMERSFGLRVVLNSVTRSNLRALDTATLDATTVQRRIQASRTTDLDTFGLDKNRDLLRLAVGTPTDTHFAKSLSGKDALMMRSETQAENLTECCARAVMLFRKTDYQRDFGFIDHVVPVRDYDLVAELDGLAFDELRRLVQGLPSDLHLAVPEILSPGGNYEVSYFGAGLRPGRKPVYSEVDIQHYIAELRDGNLDTIENMESIRTTHEIRATKDGDSAQRSKKRVYDCLVFEVEYNESIFVLFDGEWFEVDRNFYEQVETYFNEHRVTPFVASTTAKTEREFISELDLSDGLLNLDQLKLSPSRAPGANLEPSDFFSRTRQFIHLKDGGSSAPISHLWNQGLVSAQNFISDSQFRGQLRRGVTRRERLSHKTGFLDLLPTANRRPDATQYPIVFGIMRAPYARSGTLGLPFFSKVSFRSVASHLADMSFRVEVHLIEKLHEANSLE